MTTHTISNNRHDMSSIVKSYDANNTNTIRKLGPYDILFGRCKTAFNNIGNRRFRITISLNLKAYLATKSRSEKSVLFKEIVDFLKNEVGARFLKPVKGGGYIELGQKQAREKIGHALRDLAVNSQQLSSMSEWEQRSSQDKNKQIKPLQAVSSTMSPELLCPPPTKQPVRVVSHDCHEVSESEQSFPKELSDDSSSDETLSSLLSEFDEQGWFADIVWKAHS